MKLSLAAPIALGIVLAARFAASPLREVPDYDNADFNRFVAVEKYEIRSREGSPAVLLLGSSRTQYGFDRATLAAALGVPEAGVRNLALPDGNPWTSVTMLRRNAEHFDDVRTLFVDVAPIQFNGGYLPLRNRFAHLAGLGERLAIEGRPAFRAELTSDRFTGHLGIRRSLRSYGLALVNARRGTVWGHDDVERLDPVWRRESDHGKIQREMFAENADWMPANYPAATYRDYHFSAFLKESLLEIEAFAAESGAFLVIHQPPFHPVFLETIRENDEWRKHYDAYLRFLEERRSDRVAVMVWEHPEELGIPVEALLDYGHFGRDAARIYSEHLGRLGRRSDPAP